MTPIWLSAISIFVVFGVAIFGIWVWGTADSTIVIVIRPAEIAPGDPVGSPLSTAGEARAAQLARMLGDPKSASRIEAIYTDAAVPNRMTVAPLAASLGVVPIVAPSEEAKSLAHRALKEHRGGRVLIVGESDTVCQIAAALSGRTDILKVNVQDYGIMYVVSVPRIGHANVLQLNY